MENKISFSAGTQQNRDLPPRFAAKLSQQPAQMSPPPPNQPVTPMAMMNGVGGTYPQKEEISLRPAKNFNVFKPASPSNLPRSAQGAPPTSQMSKMVVTPPEPPKPLLNKQVTIFQVFCEVESFNACGTFSMLSKCTATHKRNLYFLFK